MTKDQFETLQRYIEKLTHKVDNGFFNTENRFNQLDARINNMDMRLSKIENQITNIEFKWSKRIILSVIGLSSTASVIIIALLHHFSILV